jgi:hypothetical protein
VRGLRLGALTVFKPNIARTRGFPSFLTTLKRFSFFRFGLKLG